MLELAVSWETNAVTVVRAHIRRDITFKIYIYAYDNVCVFTTNCYQKTKNV